MSLVTYNGVTLPYPFMTDFKNTARYDESDTDWYVTEFDITTQFLVNVDYLSQLSPTLTASAANSAADVMNVIRSRLLKPRQKLSVKFNGVELIPQPQGGLPGTVDARNGPKPRGFDFSLLTNNTFVCSYHITAAYWENNKTNTTSPAVTNQAGGDVLYNRWSETASIDNCNYTTRTRSGKYIIRSDNSRGFTADQFRSDMAVVGLPQGFLRVSSEYKLDPDGLAMGYTVTDKEVFKLPPEPAFEAEGRYTETSTRLGAVRAGNVRVRLKADKNTNQTALLQKALEVAVTKLAIRQSQNTGGLGAKGAFRIVDKAQVWHSLYDNEVEVDITCLIFPGTDATGGLAAFTGMDTSTPFSDGVEPSPPPYEDFGTAELLLQAAAYNDPNLQNVMLAGNFPYAAINRTADFETRARLNSNKLAPGQYGKTQEPV